ncbi:MAG: hypothetical protein NTX53_07255 [candidate division WOR-3 bacterium]|nr:hypothetical protein [candidate division WOR-3 bacterium]
MRNPFDSLRSLRVTLRVGLQLAVAEVGLGLLGCYLACGLRVSSGRSATTAYR